MRAIALALAATVFALGLSPAVALELNEHIAVPGQPAEVWAAISDYCAIKKWNPIVADCTVSKEGDATLRTLTYTDGSKVKEKITGSDDSSYSYEILDSPLPIDHYKAKLSVAADVGETNQSIITWNTTFDAKGISDQEAVAKIGPLLVGGLKGIKKMVSHEAAAGGASKE